MDEGSIDPPGGYRSLCQGSSNLGKEFSRSFVQAFHPTDIPSGLPPLPRSHPSAGLSRPQLWSHPVSEWPPPGTVLFGKKLPFDLANALGSHSRNTSLSVKSSGKISSPTGRMSVPHGKMWTDRQAGVLLYSPLHPCEGKSTHGVWVLFERPPTGHGRKGPTALVWARGDTRGYAGECGRVEEQGWETEPGSPCHVPWEKQEQSFHLVLWQDCVCSTHPLALGWPGGWSSWPPQPASSSGQEVALPVCAVMSEKND